jgi:hypothetical protein
MVENRALLFAIHGTPSDSYIKPLGLGERAAYTGPEWRNYRLTKTSTATVVIEYCNGAKKYDRGTLIYTTTGTPSHFSSVMHRNSKKNHISLTNVKAIYRIAPDYSASLQYKRSS